MGDWSRMRINKAARSGEATFILGAVIMNCKGLVDPKDPFGRVLPLKLQIKIMFWVDCILTNVKRQKVNEELKGLPKCNVTGFPQHLGEGQRWNQVVFRLHMPRGSHCHGLMDHRLSVRDDRLLFFREGLEPSAEVCVFCIYRLV